MNKIIIMGATSVSGSWWRREWRKRVGKLVRVEETLPL